VSGGSVTNANGYLGNAAGGVGTATVSSGTWANSGGLYVGHSGTGTLNVTGGSVTNTAGILGDAAGSVGTATVSGGTWANSGALRVGVSGTGTLNVTGGSVTNTDGYIGSSAGRVGTATVSGGTWANSGALFVGRSGTGVLNLSDTGVVTVGAGSGTLTVAHNPGSHGALNIGTGGAAGTLLAGVVTGGAGSASVNFNHTDTAFNFAPILAGTLSVAHNGPGTTIFAQSNTYTGGTTVTSGTLQTGNASALGTGAVSLQGGVLAVTGTLALGNYTQSRTGTLRIEVGGTSEADYSRLIVGGTAQLDGELQLVKLNRFEIKRGDKITILTAAGGVDGEFATVSSDPFDTILEPTVVYGDTTVSLEVVRGSFEKYAAHGGLPPNQRAVAGALDSGSADEPNDAALVYLDQRQLSQLPADFDRIAPEELTSIFTISTSLATVQSINLQRRTEDLRQGASGFSASGLAMQGTGPGYSGSLNGGVAGPRGQESKELKAVAPEEKKWGAFLTGVGEWVDVDGDGNARGYDITTGGFTLGLDYKVAPNFVIGVAAGYAGTGADLNDGGDVWVNGGKLGVYATFWKNTGGEAGPTGKETKDVEMPVSLGGTWYVDAAVTGGYNSYDTKRAALQGTARGDTAGGELNVLVGTGFDIRFGSLTIGPTATFQYTLVGIDGFTETGSLVPLSINSRNAESVRAQLGFKASYDWKVGGVLVRPEIRASWQHEFGDSSYALDASFANGAGHNFLVNGPELGRDSLLLGAGVAIQCSERFSIYFYYDGEVFRERYDRHGVSGGVRIAY